MTEPLPKLQILSLYRLHPDKIKKHSANPPDAFSNIVALSNKSLAENDCFKEVEISEANWKKLKAQGFKIKWWISVRRQGLSGASQSLQLLARHQEAQFKTKDIQLGTVTEHHLIFLFREVKKNKTEGTSKKVEKTWDIFALTTNNANFVIRHCADFSFPLQLARRICEPALLNEKIIPIVGDYLAIGGEYKRDHIITYSALETLSQIVKGFKATVKPTSSLYQEDPFKQFVSLNPDGKEPAEKTEGEPVVKLENGGIARVNPVKVSIGEMYVRFQHGFTLEEHAQICHQVVNIVDPIISKDLPDVGFEYFDHIRRVPKEDQELIEKLETELFVKVFQSFSTAKSPSFEFYHHHYEDYSDASHYRLRIRKKRNYIREWNVRPSAEEISRVLREHFKKKKNIGEFILGIKKLVFDFYHSKSKKRSTYPLQRFIKGEIFYQNKQYFYLDGNWCEVDGEYYSYVQNEFLRHMGTAFIPHKTQGSLPLAWVSKKGWATFALEEFKEGSSKEEWENLRKNLLDATFGYVEVKGKSVTVSDVPFPSLNFKNQSSRDALKRLWIPGTKLPLSALDKAGVKDKTEQKNILEELKKKRGKFIQKSEDGSRYVISNNPDQFTDPLKKELGDKRFARLKMYYARHCNYCEKEENYNRKYLFDVRNNGKPFSAQEGYLVFDQVYPSDQQKIELFDIAYYGPDGVWLYHVKEQVGQKTRDACSQIRTAAEAVAKSLSVGAKSNVLELMFERVISSSPTSNFQKKVKEQLTSLGKTPDEQKKAFLKIFQRDLKKISFVYAFLDDASNERNMGTELERSYCLKSAEFNEDCTTYHGESPLTGEKILQSLVAEKFIDSKYRLMDSFIGINKADDFNPKFLKSKKGYRKKNRDAIFKVLQSHLSQFNSFIAKKELLDTKRYVEKGLGFTFQICQIYRDGDPSPDLHFDTSASAESTCTHVKNWKDVFEFENKTYSIQQTRGDGACALHALNGTDYNGEIISFGDQADPQLAAKQDFIDKLQAALDEDNVDVKSLLENVFTKFLTEFWGDSDLNEPKAIYGSIEIDFIAPKEERDTKNEELRGLRTNRAETFWDYYKDQKPGWKTKYLDVLRGYKKKEWMTLDEEELVEEVELQKEAAINSCWDDLYKVMGNIGKEKIDPIQNQIDELSEEIKNWESDLVSSNFDDIWAHYKSVFIKGSYYLTELEIEIAAILYDKKNVRVVKYTDDKDCIDPSQPDPFNSSDEELLQLIYHEGAHYSQCYQF